MLFISCRNAPASYVYSGKISGTVVLAGKIDLDYQGATVMISAAVITDQSVTTGTNGVFVFADVPDGTYTITCGKSGYGTQNVTGVVISNSSQSQKSIILLPTAPPDAPDINS
jgi:hypothetical protein